MFKINRNNYIKLINFFNSHKIFKDMLKIIYKFFPLIIFISYPILLVYIFFADKLLCLKIFLVPLFVFLLVTVLRKIINEQRPYVKYGVSSLFGKNKTGESMPSRHTASAFVIAMAFMRCNVVLGIIMLVTATLIVLSRILAGVHYIRDVAVGILISLVFSVFMFI